MKTHTTNYFDTLIEVAEDSKATKGRMPPDKGERKSVAGLQYELIKSNPYKFTSDDVLFRVFAERNDLLEREYEEARKAFFSKGQPCFRASPLTKTYGFGIHSDSAGKIALYGLESDPYSKLLNDPKVRKVKAMRTSKKS